MLKINLYDMEGTLLNSYSHYGLLGTRAVSPNTVGQICGMEMEPPDLGALQPRKRYPALVLDWNPNTRTGTYITPPFGGRIEISAEE